MKDCQREMAVLIDKFELSDAHRMTGRGRRALCRRCSRPCRHQCAAQRHYRGGDPSPGQVGRFHPRRPRLRMHYATIQCDRIGSRLSMSWCTIFAENRRPFFGIMR
jgi:hypothetical protein